MLNMSVIISNVTIANNHTQSFHKLTINKK